MTDHPLGALVTGANRGIGLALVRELAARGLGPVVATYRQPASSSELLQLARRDPTVLPVVCDVTDEAAVRALAARTAREVRGLQLVVNNAGIGFDDADTILTLPLADFQRQLDVHALGPLRVVRALLPLLGPGAVVLNISSVVSGLHRLSAGYVGYAHAKSLQNAITLALAATLRERGVVVLARDPGWVSTDMGGPHAPVTPAESAAGLLDQALGCPLDRSGSFADHLGKPLQW